MAVAMERLVEETVGLLKESSSSGDICKSCLFKPEESASRAGRKIWLAKNIDLNRMDCKVCGVSKKEEVSGVSKKEEVSGVAKKVEAFGSPVRCKVCLAKEVAKDFKCKICAVPKEGEEASALRIRCKVCVDDCIFCVAKAAAFNRFKAAGGDSIETAEKEVKARPLGKVTTANLNKMKAEGGYIMKPAANEECKDNPVVTVRLPDCYYDKLMCIRPHTPLLPLAEEFYHENPTLREDARAAAVAALAAIAREENLLAQFVKKGYATVELEVKDA